MFDSGCVYFKIQPCPVGGSLKVFKPFKRHVSIIYWETLTVYILGPSNFTNNKI